MVSNLHDEAVADVLHAVLADESGDVVVVSPSGEIIDDLVTVLGTLDDAPAVRLLAPREALKTVMEDFMTAGSAADLVDEGHLSIRIAPGLDSAVIVTPETVVALVEGIDAVAGLVTDDGPFVESAMDRYDSLWEAGDPYHLRTPPLSQVRSSLEETMGPETAHDFDAVLASLETVRGNGGLDEVTISLLVAAKNRELLYDISKWGEDVGIASKATFSRTKTTLEDMGLIDTEKVPIDVGRPRLRLLLGDDQLRDADPGQLASVAQSMLGA